MGSVLVDPDEPVLLDDVVPVPLEELLGPYDPRPALTAATPGTKRYEEERQSRLEEHFHAIVLEGHEVPLLFLDCLRPKRLEDLMEEGIVRSVTQLRLWTEREDWLPTLLLGFHGFENPYHWAYARPSLRLFSPYGAIHSHQLPPQLKEMADLVHLPDVRFAKTSAIQLAEHVECVTDGYRVIDTEGQMHAPREDRKQVRKFHTIIGPGDLGPVTDVP